jgi:hypothetical protein
MHNELRIMNDESRKRHCERGEANELTLRRG